MAHLAFVSYEVAPTVAGGVGVFIAAAAALLPKDGHRVSLLLDIGAEAMARWVEKDSKKIDPSGLVKSIRVADLCEGMPVDRGDFPSDAHWQSYRFSYAVAKLHARSPIDFVEFVDYCGAAYYTLVRRSAEPECFPPRIAIRLHATIEVIDRRVAAEFQSFRTTDYALERASLAMADVVLSPGRRFWEEECASLYPNVDRRRVQESRPFRRDVPRIQNAGRGKNVVYVGRVSTLKAMDRAAHAAVATLGDPATAMNVDRFVLVGPGEVVSSSQHATDILAIAGEHADRIVFPGRLSYEQIAAEFGKAALAIFPHRMESFCYAAHEAHLAGVPLILNDLPAFRDHFVDGETALFFNGTVGDLVDKIRLCLNDDGLRLKLSESVERYRTRYQQHAYIDHIAVAPFDAGAARDVPIGIMVLADDRGREAAYRAAKTFRETVGGAVVYVLCPSQSSKNTVFLFGRSWQVFDAEKRSIAPSQARLSRLAAFVTPEAQGAAAFFATAARMLAADPRIGAVVPATLTETGRCRVSVAPTEIERALAAQLLLMAAFRVEEGATIADLANDGTEATEMSLLVALRAEGKVIVDLPDISVPAVSVVSKGAVNVTGAWLRRFAWSTDRVLLADIQAEWGAVSTRMQQVDITQISTDVELPRSNASSLTIHVPQSNSPLQSSRVTILSVRRAPNGPRLSLDELPRTGSWDVKIGKDRSWDMLVGSAGSLTVAGAIDPEATFLLGPDQGEVILSHMGQAVRINLENKKYWQMTLPVSKAFAFNEGMDVKRHAIPATLFLNRDIVDQMISTASGNSGELILSEFAEDRHLLNAAGYSARSWSMPSELAGKYHIVARAAVLASLDDRVRSIVVLGGSEFLPLVERLLLRTRIDVCYIPRPALSWHSGGWEWIKSTAALAKRFAGRLELRALPGSIAETFRLLGVSVKCMSLGIRTPAFREARGPVNLVLPARSPTIRSGGHIAAAVTEFYREAPDLLGSVYLPANGEQSALIVDRLGRGCRSRIYDDAQSIITSLEGTKVIYCAPFADDSVDPISLYTFAVGGLSIVAPGPIEFKDSEVRRILEVPFWEDANHICAHLLEAARSYSILTKILAEAGS